MSAALTAADPGAAFADMCAGVPYFLMAPDDERVALSMAKAYLTAYPPHMRGCLVAEPGARCYELKWSDMGDDPDDWGRLSAYARPWQTVDELLTATAAPDELYVQAFADGQWRQFRIADDMGAP
jgi:hypothetical protein